MMTAGAGRARQIGQTQPVLGPPETVMRLERFAEPGADKELPIGVGRVVKRRHAARAQAAEATPGDHAFEQIR